ncbi:MULTISPECIES: CRISPR-associated protein Csx16 [unclassified Vibrio]|uniref:CRISPR-associated protein Csx16 n=2 Tax=unclassified Vibrio TaxID=2614977 RepID=UPI000C84BFED
MRCNVYDWIQTMKTYFVTRHPATIDLIKSFNIDIHHWLTHVESIDMFEPGDTVLGTLPIHLVVELTEKNVNYYHFSLDIPSYLRGRELSYLQLIECSPRLEKYEVLRSDCIFLNRK